MFTFFKDFRWDKLKFDVTRLLGRMYYFNWSLIWCLVDVIVFIVCKVSFTNLSISISLIVITIITTLKWLGTLVYSTLCKLTKEKLEDLLDRSNALQGVPGCGKTSTINQMGYELAKKQWKTLQHEYWKISNYNFELLPYKLQRKYKEIIRAYNFYKKWEDKFIPCLHSFITIEVNGRKSHSLTKGHLLQVVPLPYRSVWVCDEISSLFPNSTKGEDKERNKKLAELCRWIRHFTDSFALFADIRFGDAFLAIRSGCGCVLTLEKKQKWILKPKFLIGLRDIIYSLIDFDFWLQRFTKPGSASYNKATYATRKSACKFGRFVKWLDKLISCVGYREYYYRRDGSLEQEVDSKNVLTTKGKYWFKSCLDVTYNDRAFKNLYSCRDLEFEEPKDSSFDMSKEELKQILGIT